MKMSIILVTQHAIEVPHDIVVHNLNNSLNPVADQIKLPLENEYVITKAIWDSLVKAQKIFGQGRIMMSN